MKVSAGLRHSLVLAENAEGKRSLYSIGTEPSLSDVLDCPEEGIPDSIIRECQSLAGCEVEDFSASHDYNLVLLRGDAKPTDSLYEHKLPNGESVKGVVHAYPDTENKWTFVSSACDKLPAVSVAFKCQMAHDLNTIFNSDAQLIPAPPDLQTLVDTTKPLS